MNKLIEAIYEKGVIKLVKPSSLPEIKDHQEIKLLIIPKEDIIVKSKGMFKVKSKELEEIALSEEILDED